MAKTVKLKHGSSFEEVSPPRFVVGVGASAGGLDALEKLFSTLPKDTGAAFVVIQHLSPDHKSMMASLLSRHTEMDVVIVEDGMLLEANKIYLIPPGAIMHMEGTHLRLTPKEPRTFILPIDIFFHSMAKEIGANSIGVVLSGTGSDGTRGAVSINEAGGFLIVQDPDEAKFDGMPRSAIATGLVDDILPVESIPERIVSHMRSPVVAERAAKQSMTAGAMSKLPDEDALLEILRLLMQLSGINFEEYKQGTVLRRIERRMAVRQIRSLQDYLQLLNQDRAESLTLRHELLIPVTSFFRDPDAFVDLSKSVVDVIVNNRQAGDTIRVWTAGVSTGEEAYSIAMLFMEAFDRLKRWPALKVFATDVEQANIETAASGSYPESIAAEISPERLERFFNRKGNRYVVKNELRQCIVFAKHNLLADPPFTKMDLVSCRNTLIYFGNVAQEKVLRRLQYALVPGAHLFLGSSESLGVLQKDFLTISARHKLYQLVRSVSVPLDLGNKSGSGSVNLGSRKAASPLLTRNRVMANNALDMGFQSLLKTFGPPPAILLNGAHELVHTYGDVTTFIRIPEGTVSLDVNRILLTPLIPVAAALIFKSIRENSKTSSDLVKIEIPVDPEIKSEPVNLLVKLTAMPAGEVEGERFTLLVFERHSVSEKETLTMSADIASETTERIEALEHELAATRESLQATIEELETSNEELQATNEELMASNEELQSSNEELQSVNEELNTVNAEYQEKIDILNRINADLDNLTRVVATGTVFVDENLELVRFSPEAATIFKLRDADIGRPLTDLNHLLDYPEMIDDIQHTLSTGNMLEKDVGANQGRRFMVRMLPYSIPTTSSKGVVISFVEITKLHQALGRLQEVVDGLPDSIAVLDEAGQILMVNRAWNQFGEGNGNPNMIHSGPGTNYLDICKRDHFDDYGLKALEGINSLLGGTKSVFTMEYPCNSPDKPRWFVMHARRLSGLQPGVVVSHFDITPWHQ